MNARGREPSAATAAAFDVVVVGGGTAGCIVASRLSEDPSLRVLLLEAGPAPWPQMPDAQLLEDGNVPVFDLHDWRSIAWRGSGAGTARSRAAAVLALAGLGIDPPARDARESSPSIALPMARILGGGSTINGSLARHLGPWEWDRWRDAGLEQWSWHDMSAWSERIEQGDDFVQPLALERDPEEHWTPVQRAFREACRNAGLPMRADHAERSAGVWPVERTSREGRRRSVLARYLEPVLDRPNLVVQTECEVQRVLFDQRAATRASGVEYRHRGYPTQVRSGELVLCAGAVNSPRLLLRSGIGPARELEAAGIVATIDVPGVGRGLREHPAYVVWGVPAAGSCKPGEPIHQMMAWHRSEQTGPDGVQLYMLSAVPTQRFGSLRDHLNADFALGISILLPSPASEGRVTPTGVHLALLHEQTDRRAMTDGLRLARQLLRDPCLRSHVARLASWDEAMASSSAAAEAALLASVRASGHPACSLRMGAPGDPAAATDSLGRLRGCDNVTIADASVLPFIPQGPPQLACMMVAERLADGLRRRMAGGAPLTTIALP